MSFNDPIADMLTRIRNGVNAKHEAVSIPYSKLKESVAAIMYKEGFLRSVIVAGEGIQKAVVIGLKYMPDGGPVFRDMQRVSKLGRRVYLRSKEIKPNRQGVGVAILSTSKGVMKDMDARKQGVGGEVLCTIW
jgi:small subunit ribosomal protein S8